MPDSHPSPPWGIPSYDERNLDALLSSESTDIPVTLRPLADTLAALNGPPSLAELRGEAAIMAEFRTRAEFGPLGSAHPGGRAETLELPALQPSGRHRVRRPANRRFGAFLATAAAAAVVGAVAFTGNLPGPIQRLAHLSPATPRAASSAVAKPTSPNLQDRSASSVRATPDKSARPSPSPSPSASTSPNASMLCRTFFSYFTHQVAGQQVWNQPAYRQLSTEAGGSSHIFDFCRPYFKNMFREPPGQNVHYPGQVGF